MKILMVVMGHKTKSLLQNIPSRHIIAEVDDGESIRHQLTRFRDLDIVNYFILGRLTTIRAVVDVASSNKFFSKKFSWHAITKVDFQVTITVEFDYE